MTPPPGFSISDLSALVTSLPEAPATLNVAPRLRPFVARAATQRYGKRLLWLVGSRHELAALRAQGLATWPGSDEPLHLGRPSAEQLGRARLLDAAANLDLLVAERGQTAVISPGARRRLRVRLALHDPVDQDALLASLVAAGYERGIGVFGGFDVRGDTLIVRDVHGSDVRLEFFGRTLERIVRDGLQVSVIDFAPVKTVGSADLSEFFDAVISEEGEALISFEVKGLDLGLYETPVFYRQAERFKDYVRRHTAQGFLITATGRDDTFNDLCHALGIAREDSRGVGWVWPSRRRINLDVEDFIPAPKGRAGRRIKLQELEPGAFLVHRDYGIGRLIEGVDREIDGIRRSYLLLEFAGRDRLYVPIEQQDRLTHYEGGAHPTLSRLAGGEWATTLARLKKVSAEIALELLNRYAKRELGIGVSFPGVPEAERRFAEAFPYQLTSSQEEVITDVLRDMESERPMDRLVAGDVGFGKTEIAWRAAFRATLAKKQVALIAPTTVLAEQHLATARKRFGGEEVRIAGLSRFQSPSEQRAVIQALQEGRIDLIIGTHRLLSRDISFYDLGLIIVDEEQRFGVEDKERLRRLYEGVDALTLTATPIPRTLELGLGGIRPMSVIETAPDGRRPIITKVVSDQDTVWQEAIALELKRGGQVYVITPRIRRMPAIEERLRRLFPELPLGLAHGRLPERELASVMRAFTEGEIQVLLASTIVENGLDLPAANTLLVEDPALLGLAELYQLRGRVGRGNLQGYCYLIAPERNLTAETEERIRALVAAGGIGGGLEVALRDLELRGSGNILGREQHGYISGVGLALYTELLSEARLEIEAGRRLQLREALVDLPLETAVPDEVAPTLKERVALSQQIEGVEGEDVLDQLATQLRAEHGSVESVENLLLIKRLKLRSLGTPVAAIREQTRPKASGGSRRYLVLTLEHEVTVDEEEALRALGRGWTAKGLELRLPLDLASGPAPAEALHSLEVLARLNLTRETFEA